MYKNIHCAIFVLCKFQFCFHTTEIYFDDDVSKWAIIQQIQVCSCPFLSFFVCKHSSSSQGKISQSIVNLLTDTSMYIELETSTQQFSIRKKQQELYSSRVTFGVILFAIFFASHSTKVKNIRCSTLHEFLGFVASTQQIV